MISLVRLYKLRGSVLCLLQSVKLLSFDIKVRKAFDIKVSFPRVTNTGIFGFRENLIKNIMSL